MAQDHNVLGAKVTNKPCSEQISHYSKAKNQGEEQRNCIDTVTKLIQVNRNKHPNKTKSECSKHHRNVQLVELILLEIFHRKMRHVVIAQWMYHKHYSRTVVRPGKEHAILIA